MIRTLYKKSTFPRWSVLTLLSFALYLLPFTLQGQQDPMFTKYMFNSLTFNPAYAGSSGFMSANLLHREQWSGWGNRSDGRTEGGIDNGAPLTQTFQLHSPWKKRVGLGLNIVNDAIGARNTTSANVAYAYRVTFGRGKLALGVQGGATYWRADWSKLSERDPADPVFQQMPSQWIPNFGAGVYYNSDFFYLGVSVPSLLTYELPIMGTRDQPTNKFAQTQRHYYFTVGGAIPITGPNLMFKPSLLIKSVGLLQDFTGDGAAITTTGAPIEFDIDMSLFFYETLWVGVSFRSAIEAVVANKSSFDSADVWVAYYLKNGLRIGAAYDFTLTDIQQYSNGSFELMLGYEFDYDVKRVNTPRYF